MKKNTILSIMTCAAMLLLTAACSNDENNNGQEKTIQAVQFSFTNEDFGADETLSRATSAAEAKPQTVDLGDCEAEITMESEPAVKTRGTLTNADGHYTIRAYQSGTLKGEMKGTFSGGNFTPDASSSKKLNLPYGTYDFIAFNDQVTVSGTELKVDRTDAETARMGFSTVNINSDAPIQVLFTMKHVGCRLRTLFVCQKHIPNAITATLEQTSANVIPTSVDYNPTTKSYTSTNGAMTVENSNSPASTEQKYWDSNFGQYYTYSSVSDYHYFLPTTEGSKLKLTFAAGTLFWKPLTGIIPQLNATLQMQANKSYLVTIKLKPNYTYLMSDGTTGHFKDTTFGGGSKTPVGVVANPTARVAIALKNVSDETNYYWHTPLSTHADNTTLYSPIKAGVADMDGYKWTWEAAGSTDGTTIKANQQTIFPAFYEAGHYNPGVPISGTLVSKKWYLAGLGEWYTYGAKNLGFAEDTNFSSFYGVLVDEAFTKVGGTKLTSNDIVYLMSTEFKGDAPYYPLEQFRFSFPYAGGWGWSGGGGGIAGIIRPFIKY